MLDKFKNIDFKNDDELSQALARIIISPILLFITAGLIYFGQYDDTFTLFVMAGHSLYSGFIFFNTLRKSGNYPIRRVLNIIADLGAVTLVIYACDTSAIFLYPVMLWVIVGNGVRFGVKYLYASLAFGVVFFGLATYLNKEWHSHPELSISLLIGLVVLSIFYRSIIKKLHYLNATLDSKVKERTEELRYRLYHDTLTDLKNRYALKEYMGKNNFYIFMLIDINGLKNYNELYGVDDANEILIKFANFLENFYKEKEYEVYKVYADGFAIVGGGNYMDIDIYEKELFKLLDKINDFSIYLKNQKDEIELDVTIGISLEQDHALEKAEMALKYAKKKKRTFITYSHSIDTTNQSKDTLFWKHEIKKAVILDNIVPVFQPIVNKYGDTVKYETLMRLKRIKDGKEELVVPFFFLDVAIKTNLYEKLTLIMIEKSFKIMQECGCDFSINLSFDDITNRVVVEALKENIQKYGVANQLILEILESENVENYDIVKDFAKEFREFGVRIAIDDFGSGFSNYSHILELAPDILKIDGSLIKNIDKDTNSYILVKSIVNLARTLNIKTVGEFIHSKEVFRVTKGLGVDEFQGFYFSPPITMEKLKQEISLSA